MNKAKVYTTVGIFLMLGGTVTAVIVTSKKKPKIDAIIEKHADEPEENDKQMVIDIVKEVLPSAIPVIAMEVAGVSFILGGQKKLIKSNVALSTAYAISEAAIKKYRDNVVEAIGEKKERDIYDKTAQDLCDERPVPESSIIITGDGETLCKDLLSGQEFKSDIERIRSARNEFNDLLNREDCASLNDCYYLMGIGPNDIGEVLGWNRDRDGLVDFVYSSTLVRGKPCLTISFSPAPKYDFDRFS